MKNRSLISITDYTKEEYIKILDLAETFELNTTQRILENYVVATLFFEPSTRTRLSFESAASRLGAKVIGFADVASSSVSKNYSDIIVIRHPADGSARFASEVAGIPVINAGDGGNQHPTQCMLDLYSMRKTQGKLDGLNVAFVGDLKYGRTVHSNVMALCNFDTTFHLVSPLELKLPSYVKAYIKDRNLKYHQYTDLNDIMEVADIIYMTRIQKERFSDPIEYEKVKNAYILNGEMLEGSKENMRILHPLPRVNEITEDVDASPHAYYFQQAQNGVYVRQALLAAILGVK